MPIHPQDQEKLHSARTGNGTFQFSENAVVLTGALSSFQRLMDKILRGLPFMTHYIDDVLIHSQSEESHKEHLRIVYECLWKVELSLRGRKCHICRSTVSYLGHIFSGTGMAPDQKKILDVQEWL